MAVAGTLKRVTLNGVTYDALEDANAKINLSPYKVEAKATTGKVIFVLKLRVQTISDITLGCTPREADALKTLSAGADSITMSITLADGSVFRSTGHIDFDSFETMEGKCKIDLIPDRTRDAWTLFEP